MYSISQVSQKLKLPAHTLRFYEREGLLPSVGRSEGGIRAFSEGDLEWLGLICCLKATGMSIRQIRAFVDLSKQGDETLEARSSILAEHKQAMEEQMRTMAAYLVKIDGKIGWIQSQIDARHG